MVSLHAFIDNSASDVGSRRLFLAGYIHGAESWISFSAAWRAALVHPPAIQYFKMAEAQSLRGQFRQWTQANRDRKLLSLAKVIQDHDPWAVHCSVSRDDYARILAPVAPYPLKNPYSMCFWAVIQTAAVYHRELGIEGTPPVDFVFDQQGGLGDDAALWYDWMKQQQDPEICELLGDRPIFCDDKQVVALQAADMLAWHVRRADEGGDLPVPEVADMIQGHGASREVPVQGCAKVLLHLRHQLSGEGTQRVERRAVLRRDDESELVPVSFSPGEERLAIRVVAECRVESPLLALARDAVPLKVSKMRAGSAKSLRA